MNQVRPPDEAARLRQVLGAVLVERETPLRLHLSSLHMARNARIRIEHDHDAACMILSLEPEERSSDDVVGTR